MKKQIYLTIAISGVLLLLSSTFNSCIQEGTFSKATIETNQVTSITEATAFCGGVISGDGGSNVTARGVCWSTSPNPTIENDSTIDDAGTGSFTSLIKGLTPSTTYFIRAYAVNKSGAGYGLQTTFTTKTFSITTAPIDTSLITATSAIGGGNIISDGESSTLTVKARGVCWNTFPSPTIENRKTVDGVGGGGFTSMIDSLKAFTTYYVRAYATNGNGTIYGNEVSFTTRSIDFLMGLSFDEGAGTQLTAVGKGWTAVLKKGPAEIFGTATNFPSYINGKVGKAMYFSNGSHLEISDYTSSDLLGSKLSIAVWVKPDLTRAGNYIMSYNYWNTWKFQLQEQNKPFFTIHTNADGWVDAFNHADFSAPNNVWTHLVVTLDMTTKILTFYVNGESTMVWNATTQAGLTGTGAFVYGTTLPLMIGACTTYTEALTWDWSWAHTPANWDGFVGAMDELKLYNIALTEGQVSKLYNEEK